MLGMKTILRKEYFDLLILDTATGIEFLNTHFLIPTILQKVSFIKVLNAMECTKGNSDEGSVVL